MRERLMIRYEPAARSALAAFGIQPGELHLHSIAENITFKVIDEKGQAYALRLHRPGYRTLDELESEHCWTAALRESGLAVPRACVSLTGCAYVPISIDNDHERRYAGVSQWTDGVPLSGWIRTDGASPDSLVRVMGALGSLLAQMHLQAIGWHPPVNFRRPHLDADALLGEEPRWGRFWEHPGLTARERNTLLAARGRLQRLLKDLDKNSNTYGVIHSDMHADNLLISADGVSVIDFDDAAFGWFCYDLASALQPYVDLATYETWRTALLDAYRRSRSFDTAEERLLDAFLLVRDLAEIGWYMQRPEVENLNRPQFLQIKNRCVRASDLFVKSQERA